MIQDFSKQPLVARLAIAMGEGMNGLIEQQEANGQRQLVNSAVLPKNAEWATLQRWGVIKGDSADDLFVHCQLPEGWQKRATDHSMWSELIDAEGLKRASIFYKAAFYDRDAFVDVIEQRYRAVNRHHDGARGYGIVVDQATEQTVAEFPVGRWGIATDENGDFPGLIFDGAFYSCPLYDRTFRDKQDNLEGIEVISDKQFYDRFHNQDIQNYELIYAADALILAGAEKLASELNAQANW